MKLKISTRLLESQNRIRNLPYYYRIPIYLFQCIVIIILIFITLIYPSHQGIQIYREELSTRVADYAQIRGVIEQNKALENKSQKVKALDENELEKIKLLIATKGLKISTLQEQIVQEKKRIYLQFNQASFSSVIDVISELRMNWNLIVVEADAKSAGQAGIVQISLQLEQRL